METVGEEIFNKPAAYPDRYLVIQGVVKKVS